MQNLYTIGELSPQIGEGVFIAVNASVIGAVEIGIDSSVWFQTVIRGDVDKVVIGKQTNIQDLCMLHVTKGFPLLIHDQVTIGHHVVLHGCEIGENSLIGIGAIINDGAKIGAHSVVAAGCLVPPGKSYPDGSLLMGSPAKVIRKLDAAEIKSYGQHYLKYIANKNLYLSEFHA